MSCQVFLEAPTSALSPCDQHSAKEEDSARFEPKWDLNAEGRLLRHLDITPSLSQRKSQQTTRDQAAKTRCIDNTKSLIGRDGLTLYRLVMCSHFAADLCAEFCAQLP